MTNEVIYFSVAVEDALSEVVARHLIEQSSFRVLSCYRKGGYGYLKSRIHGFNEAAKASPFFMLTDLDKYACATELKTDWLKQTPHPNFLFRIAVRSVESWLLADAEGLATFFRVSKKLIPDKPDELPNPKAKVIELAKRSSKREIREDIVPKQNSTAKIGPNYNGRLGSFINTSWNLQRAIKHSESLHRAFNALKNFKPTS